MKPATSKLVCAALLGAIVLAWGQDRAPDETTKVRSFGNGVLSEHISIYDVDHSGGLSMKEYQALQADRNQQGVRNQRFSDRWDKNRDGHIDAAEREEAAARIRQLIAERRSLRFNEVDLNSDGFLTQTEFLRINAVTASDLNNPGVGVEIFKRLDLNEDRRISKEEFLRSLDTVRPSPVEPAPTPKPRDSNTLNIPVRPAAP